MKNLKERWKRKAAIGLTAIMLMVQLPAEAADDDSEEKKTPALYAA